MCLNVAWLNRSEGWLVHIGSKPYAIEVGHTHACDIIVTTRFCTPYAVLIAQNSSS